MNDKTLVEIILDEITSSKNTAIWKKYIEKIIPEEVEIKSSDYPYSWPGKYAIHNKWKAKNRHHNKK